MFSPFLGVVTWLTLMGMCQAGNLDRSSLAPLSIVYTVYPYYNTDTLLGVFKAEENLQLSNNVNAFVQQSQEDRNSAENSRVRDGPSGSNDRESNRNDNDESAAVRNEQTAEITYWPPVQRGAAPKPRLPRTTGLRPANLKSGV